MIIEDTGHGGLIVVGSHTEKTTKQLSALMTNQELVPLHLRCKKLLESEEAFCEEINRCVANIEEFLEKGQTVTVYTDRVVISKKNEDPQEALIRSVRISEAVYNLVKNLKVKPEFVLAKGGITSADIGVKGLGIRKTLVLGQIEPGVPVWKALDESKFPNIPYIIFPGNVGDDNTLKNAVEKLLG